MQKPNDYDNTQAQGEYIPVELGGHKLVIKQVTETTSKTGKPTTNTSENVMYIREDVYKRAVKGNPRDRFTLCHEIGHYFLHRPETISNARGEVPRYCDPEWQADAFAGELMAPRNLIKGMTSKEIAEECGMSMTAADIQYKVANRC